MPPVSARYLIEWLSDIGWAESGGMGAVALSASEIKAWCEMTDTRLEPWEFDALRAASRAYVSQTHSDHSLAPWTEEDRTEAKASIAGRFKSLAQQINRT